MHKKHFVTNNIICSINIELHHSCEDQITLNLSWSSEKNVVTFTHNKGKNEKEHKLPLPTARWNEDAQRSKYITISLFTWGVGEEFNFPFNLSKAVSVEYTSDPLIASLCDYHWGIWAQGSYAVKLS